MVLLMEVQPRARLGTEPRITEPKHPTPAPINTRRKFALLGLASVFVLINIAGIARRFRKRVHFEMPSVAQLAYPRCADDRESGRAEVPDNIVASTQLRALPEGIDRGAWERFRLRIRGCHRVVQVHRETPQTVVDAEIVLDAQNAPIRAWRRIGTPSPTGVKYDTRVYEFRTPFVTVTRRSTEGTISCEEIRSKQKPTVILAPGVSAITIWTQQSQLRAGDRTQAWVLDLREPLERAWQSTLRRAEDMDGSSAGVANRRTVRVYSLDEESFFADNDNRVVGDLGGMREAETNDLIEVEGQTPPNPEAPLVVQSR